MTTDPDRAADLDDGRRSRKVADFVTAGRLNAAGDGGDRDGRRYRRKRCAELCRRRPRRRRLAPTQRPPILSRHPESQRLRRSPPRRARALRSG